MGNCLVGTCTSACTPTPRQTMPPANIQWTEPLVQDVDLYTSNSIVVRRLSPKSKTECCSTIHNGENGSCELLEGSPGRSVNPPRRRKRNNSRQLFRSRAINAAFWLVILVGMLYYRRMLHTAGFPWDHEEKATLHLEALKSSSNIINPSTSQQQDHVSRSLQTEFITMDEPIVHIIHTR